MANGITIDQLAEMCKKAQAAGLGSKMIIMSSDDEGNEYHQAWEGLHDGKEFETFIESYQLRGCISDNIADYVVLT
jgi:hypothetical protein